MKTTNYIKERYHIWKEEHKRKDKLKHIDTTIESILTKVTQTDFSDLEQVHIIKEVLFQFKEIKELGCKEYKKQAKNHKKKAKKLTKALVKLI